MKAVIISIGNEIIQGRIVNSNASYLSRRLTLLGLDVVAHISIGDSFEDISKAFDIAIKIFGASLIVTTGGLGPTYDDITSEALSRYLGEEHVLNEEALKEIKEKYERRGMNLTPERIKMAYMPRSARPLPNSVGIAPGILVERENLIIIALPGVPSEMEGIWENHVEPYLRRFGRRRFAETTIRLVGVPESSLARIINSFVRNRGNVYVKSHPKGHEIRGPVIDLYIMTSTESSEDPSIECAKNCRELLELLERENPELMIEGECICKPNIA